MSEVYQYVEYKSEHITRQHMTNKYNEIIQEIKIEDNKWMIMYCIATSFLVSFFSKVILEFHIEKWSEVK